MTSRLPARRVSRTRYIPRVNPKYQVVWFVHLPVDPRLPRRYRSDAFWEPPSGTLSVSNRDIPGYVEDRDIHGDFGDWLKKRIIKKYGKTFPVNPDVRISMIRRI